MVAVRADAVAKADVAVVVAELLYARFARESHRHHVRDVALLKAIEQ